MTELDTAHVGKPIIVSKDSLTLSNKEMMEKPISGHGKYIVKEGDNLYNISLKIGIDVAELKRKNRLRSNLIHVGDTLVY